MAAAPSEVCCVCGSPEVVYRNYKDMPFCEHCANCGCGGLGGCIRVKRETPTAYLIRYPKGKGEDLLIEDQHLTLDIRDGWAVLADPHGPCLAIPSASGATITRIDADPQHQAGG